ncbi:SMC5-SMC6 complex localization factor protein 2 [Holothuria leucospilota]|uniref:SMC5-SMC6 complex localization factor protein 2 n=1 Tax=Holothuria leucospilota TaxID=206669 RepID=A0A9Q0YTY9_HOLLE|nr:SMC5-SMC6 complex localization factor protein 2 [Holothuria leucospilota]
MSAEEKLHSSGFSPGTSEITGNLVCKYSSKQATEVGKDPAGDERQCGSHLIQPICNQTASQQNIPKVVTPSPQRQSNMEDMCREKEGTAVLNMAPRGNKPIPTVVTPPVNPPSSSAVSSQSSSSHVPSSQQDYRKLPQRNVPEYSAFRSHPVPHHSVPSPQPQATPVGQHSATYLHAVPQARSAPLKDPVLSLRHNLQQPHERIPKDPCSNQQKDQSTLAGALNPDITRTTSTPAIPNEMKKSNFKDGFHPSPNVNKESPGLLSVRKPSVHPKDPRTCLQKDLGAVGSVVTPDITRMRPTTPSDSGTSNIKDSHVPSTNLSKKSPGHFVVKQPSGSPKDPRTCLQRDQQTLVSSSVHPEATTSTSRPTSSVELVASGSKDGSLPQVKVNSLHVISERRLVKQPKVVLKRLEPFKKIPKEERTADENGSVEKELRNAHLKLRSSIDAITKDDDEKSVHIPVQIPKVMPHVHPSTSRLSMSKHHLSSSSMAMHSFPSKSKAARDANFHSRKHSFGRSRSFSYSSSWRTPNKVEELHSPSSDPSWKMKANPSSGVKDSSRHLYGKHSARALSYEERNRPLPLLTTDNDSLKESEQRGVRMRIMSSNSTVPKQIAPSLGHKMLGLESNSIRSHAETLSDSEANVRRSVSTHFKHKNKPVKPFVVDKKPKHSPNQSVSQHLPPSEGKLRDSSNSQKNSSYASSENQPSFRQLLEIASKNTNQVGNHDWEYSRKRRYSDGQINKCQPTDPRHFLRPFPEGVSSIKIPKLERLKEHLGETSNSENVKTVKDKEMQRSIPTTGKAKNKLGEMSDTGKGVGVCQDQENSVSVEEVSRLSSAKSDNVEEKREDDDDYDDGSMSCEDAPEDVEMTSEATPLMEGKSDCKPGDEKKGLTPKNLFEMLQKKEGKMERKVEDTASKKDLKEDKSTGSDVQRLFSELQTSSEESKKSNPSSPSTSSKASSPSGSEKRLLSITSLKKVKHILTGIALKRQASVDSDASTKDGSSSSTSSSEHSGDERQQGIPSSGDQNRKENERALDDGDIFTTENSGSESSEDDDSVLQLKPSALIDETIDETKDLVNAPMPVTPSKMSYSQVSYSPVLPESTRIRHQGVAERSQVGYTLDKILNMKKDQDKKDGDITAIRDKLMDDVSRGGIAKLATETDESDEDIDIDPESVEYAKVKKFPRKSERIPDVPPGEEIFDPEKICKLFTPTQCLCVKSFVSNGENQTSMESLLISAAPEEVEELITSSCLEMCETVSDDMMRWMFLLMSIHPSAQENHHLYQTQWMHLNKAPLISNELRFPWVPSLKDFISVLLNYGGDLAGLVSVSDCELDFSEEMLRDEFSQGHLEGSSERRDICFKEEEGVFVMILKNHLCRVIKILTQAIFTHMALKDCSGYRTEELQCLLIIMMRIALDKTVIGLPVAVDITMAIAAILEGFEDSVWYQEVERMCVLFPLITSHHHNMVYLLWSCMPLHVERGRYLCRRLSYAGLQNLVLPEKNTQRLSSSLDQTVPYIKISSLIPILQCCKPSKATDYYQLNSIIQLLDYTIGNEVLENYEKRDLDQIYRRLREMVGDIRDSALSLSRSQVKSLLLRTATKLSFMTQSMLSNQKSIFGFLRSDTPVGVDEDEEEGNPEHHIRSQDDAASLPSDDGDDACNVEMEPLSDNEVEAEDGQARVKDESEVPRDNEGKEGQGVREEDKQVHFEKQGLKEGQTEIQFSVPSGKSCANKDVGKESDIPSGLEVMDTSDDNGDQLDPGITTGIEVEPVSKETELKSGIEAGVEEIKTSESIKEVEQEPGKEVTGEVSKTYGGIREDELEPEIKAGVEVSEIDGDEKVKRDSESLAGEDSEKQSGSDSIELQQELAVDKGESGTSESFKDLKQKTEISDGVREMQTSEGKILEQNSEGSAGLEIEETLERKKAETEPDVKVTVQVSESPKSKEVQLNPAQASYLEAGESLTNQKLPVDSEVQAAVSDEKALSVKEFNRKSGAQVPVEAGEVSRCKGQAGESSSKKEVTTFGDIGKGGEGLMEKVTLSPCVDEGATLEKVPGASSPTKKSVWVPVKVECDLSPVKGSFEEDIKRSDSTVGYPVPSAARGGAVVKIEKDQQDIIDLTSPERKDAPSISISEVIELDSADDDDDVICLD